MVSVFNKVEIIERKGENADYLFSQCFKKHSLLGLLKEGIVWSKG